jgi:hypothetical protein
MNDLAKRRQALMDEHRSPTARFEAAVERWHESEVYAEGLERLLAEARAENDVLRRGFSAGAARLRPNRRKGYLALDTFEPLGSVADLKHG